MNRIVDEQRRRNQQSRQRWDLFRPHRERVTQLLEESGSAGGRLCALGAGNCNDLDLTSLLASFREVHLVDLDPEALQTGVASQGYENSGEIFIYPGADVTFMANLLAKGTPENPPDNATLDACLQAAADHPPLDVPTPFDTVASVCLLTQLLGSTVMSLGEHHPRYVEMTMGMRAQHLRLLLNLLRPGGTAVLALDFVSSATCPELPHVLKSHMMDKAVQLVSQKNFFTGVNPFIIRHLFETDPELAPSVETAEMTGPWLWDLGPRVYFVCGIKVRKRPVRSVPPRLFQRD